jgi:small subunit ribosomal protein S20
MPNVKSAEKRVRTSKRRNLRNRAAGSALRTALKVANAAVSSGEAEAAKTAMAPALGLIGASRRKGLVHRNKAARLESRLVKKVNALSAHKAEAAKTETT